MPDTGARFDPLDAVLFDLDGVLTPTAEAHMLDRFAVVVDGVVAAEHGIIGKTAPDTYLYGAELLGRAGRPSSGRRGCPLRRGSRPCRGFGHVLGVDRGAGSNELLAGGADTVVDDLGELAGRLRDALRGRDEENDSG